jgi:hypothetical protein
MYAYALAYYNYERIIALFHCVSAINFYNGFDTDGKYVLGFLLSMKSFLSLSNICETAA